MSKGFSRHPIRSMSSTARPRPLRGLVLSSTSSLLAALAALTPLVPNSFAGDYHDGDTLVCAECHVMHPGAAERDAGVPVTGTATGAKGGFDVLSAEVGALLREDVNDLCLSCHDDSPTAADVLGTNRGRSPSDVRQAGYLNRGGFSGLDATGHTLDSTAVAPGSSPPWSADGGDGRIGLACIDCHQHHGARGGTRTYRNLRSDAGNNHPGDGLVTYNHDRPGVLDPTRDVFVRRERDYDESAVDFLEPDSNDSAMARFCAGCHDTFHAGAAATTGERGGFTMHPVAGVDIGARGGRGSSLSLLRGHRSRLKLMSSTGRWNDPGPDVTPTCITCHKAHGNGNAFGLIYRSGEGLATEDGDTRGGTLESLCQHCHTQGL